MSPYARTEYVNGSLTLRCAGCGELLVLLGREGGWYESPGPVFECGGCGRNLSLGSRVLPDARDSAAALPENPPKL